MVNPVTTLLTTLAACLCEQIRADELPEPCFCGVLPGERVAVDYINLCEEQDGMAWTRLALSYPASAVGVVNQNLRNCSGGLGVEIEIGIMRAAPTMTEDGEPPSAGDQLASVELQMDDMLAMRKAVACCSALDPYDYILSQYRPSGPLGYALGGTFTVMVAL